MGTSVSSAAMARIRTVVAAAAAFLLALGLAPVVGLADEPTSSGNAQVDSVAGPLAGPGYEGDARSASADSSSEGLTLASALTGPTASIVSADVALDASDPIVGSFTVDGLTYAVGTDGVTLVAVDAAAISDGVVTIPSQVTYGGTIYSVTAVGPYAFYLSGAASVELPDSIASVDCRAFRSSDVERVEVDPGNPNLTSFDGCLYDSQLSSLLLIPEGRAGSVPIPSEAEVVEASKFSHCSLADAISVDGDGADFASWDGLLYDASGTTLLRVPAGATEITIRDGCTSIAAGALEGCAKLERINAPATVTSISPDVFESVPTVSLPIASALQDGSQDDSVAGPLAGPGYEGDARSASADPPAEGEPADSAQVESEAEVAPRRVVASSQGDGAEEAEGAFGSEVPTSPQPPSASSAESADTVASSSLDQVNESADSAPQLTAMVALSSADDDLPEVDPSSMTVRLPYDSDVSAWEGLGLAVELSEQYASADLQSAEAYGAVYIGTCTLYANASDAFLAKMGGWSGMASSITADMYGSCAIDGGLGVMIVAWFNSQGVWTGVQPHRPGYQCSGWNGTFDFAWGLGSQYNPTGSFTEYAQWKANNYTIAFDANGGSGDVPASVSATYDQSHYVTATSLSRPGYAFDGWATAPTGPKVYEKEGPFKNLTTTVDGTVTLYAHWERVDYDVGFDTSSEPGGVDYPGEAKPDKTINKDSGAVPIEDPKRPGYVFEGWVMPTEDGTEAVDQDLVYQGDDGKWYVDASKLPGYAGDDGRVELTARWTSVISVDVPSSVTFYADLVTQGQESREGAASSAFGQSKVANQSQVDLRVVGLESSAVKTTDTTLGADSILKKADAATPSTSSQKLLSLYPSTKQWKPEDLQDPDAVGGSKATTAVDFDLDDVLLERSFKADDFTIAAGGILNMGYRLNLAESGQQLDYDKLATLEEGQSASIANVSYTFAADGHSPTATGSTSDDLYIEHDGRIYGLDDIKASADCIAQYGTASLCYDLYESFMESGMDPSDPSDAHGYVRWGDGTAYSVRIIGIDYDDKADGTGKAPLTFEFVNLLNTPYQMNPAANNVGGWNASRLRDHMNPYGADELMSASGTGYNDIWDDVPMGLREVLVPVGKKYYRTYNDLDTLAHSDDYLFLKGAGEYATTFSSASNWIGQNPFLHGERPDGCDTPYQYYALLNLDTSDSRLDLISCGFEKDPDTPVRHWQRTMFYDYPYTFFSFKAYGGGSMSETKSTDYYGVRPCFCL